MTNKDSLKFLIDKLEEKKPKFLADLRTAIESHISSKKTEDCLILVTRPTSGGGTTIWYPFGKLSQVQSYVPRLIAFLNPLNDQKIYKESGREYIVDSVLTDEVVQIVTNQFTQFYKDNQQLISEYALVIIASDQRIADCLLNSLVKNNKATRFATERIKGGVKDFLLGSFQERVHDFTGILGHKISIAAQHAVAAPITTAVAAKLATAVSHAASYSTSKVIIMKISTYVASHLGTVVAKVMAVPAIKAVITKLITASVVAALVKAIVVKTGMGLGSAVTVVLVPILLVFLAAEWMGFSEKLGEDIADSISKELGGDFSKTNSQILTGLFEEFLGDQGEELGKMIAQDEEVTKQLTNLLTFIHA